MLFNVLHYDKDLSDEDLFNFFVYASSPDEAISIFNERSKGIEDRIIYAVGTVEWMIIPVSVEVK